MDNNGSVSVQVTTRPLRLAFAVRPNDTEQIADTLTACTCLWGGQYNYFVPLVSRRPAWLDDAESFSAKRFFCDQLEGIEPDFLVHWPSTRLPSQDLESPPRIQFTQILHPTRKAAPGYGVSVTRLFDFQYQKAFRFSMRHPTTVVLPRAVDRWMKPFVAACFGSYPQSDLNGSFSTYFRDAFDAQEEVVTPDNFIRLLFDAETPLTAGAAELRHFDGMGWQTLFVLLMDATSGQDLIDFWNLRAFGAQVVPIPIQWMAQVGESLRPRLLEYLQTASRNSVVTVLKARAVDTKDFEGFAQTLRAGDVRFVTQVWMPPLWRKHDERRISFRRVNAVLGQTRRECAVKHERVQVDIEAPEFAQRVNDLGTPQWASVITFRAPFGDDRFALTWPRGLRDVQGLLRIGSRPRITTEGLVIPMRNASSEQIKLPSGIELATHWAEENGLGCSMSGAGRVSSRLIEALGGFPSAYLIGQPRIIKLFERMAQGGSAPAAETTQTFQRRATRGRWIGQAEFLGELERALTQVRLPSGARSSTELAKTAARNMLGAMLKRGIVRLGAQLVCTECSQSNWFSIPELSDENECERCLAQFPFPSVQPPRDLWHYRTQGSFAIENYAYGAYSVALTLAFFWRINHAFSWSPSVELKDESGGRWEADFIAWHRGGFAPKGPDLLIAECKSFGEAFSSREVAKLELIAQKFPEATIVVATMREEYSLSERRRLRALSRRLRRGAESNNRLIVLSAYELFGDGPPLCWETHPKGANIDDANYGIGWSAQKLATITQVLHLEEASR